MSAYIYCYGCDDNSLDVDTLKCDCGWFPGKDDIERLERELAEACYAGELLAVMHGDGGHYITDHGWRKAVDDALAAHYARLVEIDKARAEAEALRTALAMMYDKWVDGDDCYEEPDTFSGLLGKAFQLSLTEEDHVISLIGKDCPTRAIDGAIAKEPVQVPAGECPYPIRQDHSIAACVEAGDCGCGEQKP
ncbi:MAG: hypothetical protein IT480_02410 [Gammaproteobacteria bacterium]|nr:hypothetical protein [Gammaproteobacteria bacterium]